MGAQAIMEKVTGLLSRGEVSEEAQDMILSCTQGCGHICAKACELGLRPSFALLSGIAKLVDAGIELPPSAYHMVPGDRRNFAKVFSSLLTKPSEVRWIKDVPADPESVETVFFPGCSASGMSHISLDAVGVLDSMGMDFVTLAGGDRCCGVGHTICGNPKASAESGQELISDIAAFRPQRAVFFCLGCQLVTAGMLSQSDSVSFETVELSKFLLDNLERIPFKEKVDKRVAIHDSCVLSSLPNYADIPRKLLQAIPGVELVELEHNREEAICCGGVANATRPEAIAHMRSGALEEANSAGIDILATYCSGCHESFVPLESGHPYEIKNYVSLIAEAVGVCHEDRYKKFSKDGSIAKAISEARESIEASDYTLEEMTQILADYPHQFSRG
jgi:Fe-S oxidoreductase